MYSTEGTSRLTPPLRLMGTFPLVTVYVPRPSLANHALARSMTRTTVPDLDFDDFDESNEGALLQSSSLERSCSPASLSHQICRLLATLRGATCLGLNLDRHQSVYMSAGHPGSTPMWWSWRHGVLSAACQVLLPTRLPGLFATLRIMTFTGGRHFY